MKVIDYTIFPIDTIDFESPMGSGGYYVNDRPFYSIYAAVRDQRYWQIVGNLLLLCPLGFLVPLMSRKWNRWYKAVLLGLIGSFAIESAQLLLHLLKVGSRLFDPDDLLLNTAGTLLGYLAYRVAILILGLFVKKRSQVSV